MEKPITTPNEVVGPVGFEPTTYGFPRSRTSSSQPGWSANPYARLLEPVFTPEAADASRVIAWLDYGPTTRNNWPALHIYKFPSWVRNLKEPETQL